jgi:polynucleotide 5'-kinase involved in rRNA processing
MKSSKERFFILGKTPWGKTYMMRYLLDKAIKNGERVYILDPKKDGVKKNNDK